MPPWQPTRPIFVYVVVKRADLESAETDLERFKYVCINPYNRFIIAFRSVVKYGISFRPSGRAYDIICKKTFCFSSSSLTHGMKIVKELTMADAERLGVDSAHAAGLVAEWCLESKRFLFTPYKPDNEPLAGEGSIEDKKFLSIAKRNPAFTDELLVALADALKTQPYVEPKSYGDLEIADP